MRNTILVILLLLIVVGCKAPIKYDSQADEQVINELENDLNDIDEPEQEDISGDMDLINFDDDIISDQELDDLLAELDSDSFVNDLNPEDETFEFSFS